MAMVKCLARVEKRCGKVSGCCIVRSLRLTLFAVEGVFAVCGYALRACGVEFKRRRLVNTASAAKTFSWAAGSPRKEKHNEFPSQPVQEKGFNRQGKTDRQAPTRDLYGLWENRSKAHN